MDDDSWRSKCSGAAWPPLPPPPPPMAPSPLPPPAALTPGMLPPAAPPHPPPPGPVGQVGINLNQHFHSFIAQRDLLNDRPKSQDAITCKALMSDSSKLGKLEPGNSFLALLSGELPQFSNSKAPQFVKLHFNSNDAAIDSASCRSARNVQPIARNQGTSSFENWNELSPFTASRSSHNSSISKAPLHLQTEGSLQDASARIFPQQTSQMNAAVFAANSVKHNWITSVQQENAGKHHSLNVQASHEVPAASKCSISYNASPFLRAHPRVFCRDTVGELFMSDMGLFGVVCLCHNSHMSLAKFCEHSGVPRANPGEVVHLENGMTISDWCKQCLGIVAQADSKRWEGPESWRVNDVSTGSKVKTTSSLLDSTVNVNNIEESGVSELSGRHSSSSAFNSHPQIKAAVEMLHEIHGSNMRHGVFQELNLGAHNTVHKKPPSLTKVSLAKNHSMQAGKQIPVSIDYQKAHSTVHKGKDVVRQQPDNSNVHYREMFSNNSIQYPCPWTKSSTHGYDMNIDKLTNKASLLNKNVAILSIDLELRQPSKKNHSFADSVPTSMLQFGTPSSNSQKKQSSQQLNQDDNSGEAEKSRSSLNFPLGPSSYDRYNVLHAVGTVNAVDHPESDASVHDATKNSLISLFLSHLEGNNTSQSLDSLLNNSEHSLPRVGNDDSFSAKPYIHSSLRDSADENERKSNAYTLSFPERLDDRKAVQSFDNAKMTSNCAAFNNWKTSNRVLTSSTNEVYLQSSSFTESSSGSLYDQPSGLLQNPCVRSQHQKAFFISNKDFVNYAVHNSSYQVSTKMDPLSVRSDVSMNPPSATLCSLKPNSSWSNRKSVNMTKDFVDQNWKYFAPSHVVEFSKQEKPTDSVIRNPENQMLCHLSPRDNAIPRDCAVPVLVNEGPQCNSYQNVSDFAMRPWPFCRSVSGADRGEVAAHRGSSRCCSCTGSTEIDSLGPERNGKNISTCHNCGMDDQPCLRLGRQSDQCINGDYKQENCKQKEHVSGKYCSPVHCHCVSGCCIIGSKNTCSTHTEQRICVEAKAKHIVPDCEKDYLLPECKRIRRACILRSNDISSEERARGKAKLKNITPGYDKSCSLPDCNKVCQDYCNCSKNDILSRSEHQTAMWRDVPGKGFAHTSTFLADRIKETIETMKVVDDKLAESSGKHFNGIDQESQMIRAQQTSVENNVSSGSSVPVITEVSVENNNAISQAPNIKVVNDFIVDEGSGIEKCDSSHEAHGNEITAFSAKAGLVKSKIPCFQSDLSGNTGDELYSSSQSKCKRDNNLKDGECPSEENSSQRKKFGKMSEVNKRINSGRWKKSVVLDSDFPANHPEFSGTIAQSKIHFSPSEYIEVSGEHDNLMKKFDGLACESSSVKRKRSVLSSSNSNFIDTPDNQNKMPKCDEMQTRGGHHSIGRIRNTAGKRRIRDLTAFSKEKDAADAGKPQKYVSLNCIINTPNSCKTTPKKTKPVVCGNSGIIFNKGNIGQEKPAKILSLSVILKKARQCSATEIYKNTEPTISLETKNACLAASNKEDDASFSWKSSPENEDSNLVLVVDTNPGIPYSSSEVQGPGKNDGLIHNPPTLTSKTTCESSQSLKSDLFPKILRTKLRQKYKDIHYSRPIKLAKKGRYTMKSSIGTNMSAKGVECQVSELCTRELPGGAPPNDTKSVTNSKDHEDYSGKLSQQTRRFNKQKKCFKLNSDAFCCVCASANQEDANQMLECSSCLIRVHQACYGVSRIPKGHWQCRPCKSGSKNIVCVLCGYDGGAMTKALKCQNSVKSLLKAWEMIKVPDSMESTHSSEIQKPIDKHLNSSAVDGSSKPDKSGSVTVVNSICLDSSPRSALEKDLQKHPIITVLENCIPEGFQLINSIAAGVSDPCGTYWVHMVCGLWTPGTRCPNVDTMSAFDVSGASPAKKNTICSICNRPGGSCIICRIPNCTITFHPWCAHQKGLLQSETEGDDAEKVGFYGKCLQHAMVNSFHVRADINELEEIPENKEIACARAEGFKGRGREKVFQHTQKPHTRRGECIVSQEQINAWLHINGQKSSARWAGKLPCFDVEHDFRKEYIRYKQSKGWKNLVVYKSGIHALGLYTSQFIPRGAMVVEYVGEIVGLRVADKREIEYQSGRRMQYKSACYFFRLDKEHIIDATRKGGIARFVNHSCLPNCVAKIISIRNEKKVVFFAERNINPGEEITYDYHFNSEDEGKKIPCFCKSKNCRRYLN